MEKFKMNKEITLKITLKVMILIIIIMSVTTLNSAWLENLPIVLVQSNGTKINAFSSGQVNKVCITEQANHLLIDVKNI
jgi:hypothetical protein